MATEEQITREQKIDVLVSAGISATIITGLAVGFLVLQYKHNKKIEAGYTGYLKALIQTDREYLAKAFDSVFDKVQQ